MQTNRCTVPVLVVARLFLLLGALGTWVTVVQWAAALFWAGPVGWTIWIISVLYGVITPIGTITAHLRQPGKKTVRYLALNGCLGAVLVILAFLQADPEPHLAIVGASAIAAGLLTLVANLPGRAHFKRLALVVAGLLIAYVFTYALPTTLPVVAAIHLEGVLTLPPNTEDVVRVGAPFGDRGNGTPTYTVNPGTYRVGLACTGYVEPRVPRRA